MRQVRLTFEDKDFKKLSNAKEEAVINGDCTNWEDFILKLKELAE